MEFLHPTDFPLMVVTEASHAAGAGVGVVMEAGSFSVTAFASLDGAIS